MTSKLIHIASRAMLSLLLAVIVGALAVVTVIPRAVHGAALTVLTGSMSPTIPVGSTVVVRPVDPGTLRVGDVVTFQRAAGENDFITHRIIKIDSDTSPITLTTKGDANRGADIAPVPVTAVRGKVLFHVPYLGTLRNAVGTGGAGLLLLMLGLIGYAAAQVSAWVRERNTSVPASAESAPPTADAAGSRLTLQLLVVTFPIAEFEGLLPHQVATLLRMDILDESPDQFTVTVAREPQQLRALTEALLPFNPVSITCSDVVTVPICVRIPSAPLAEQLEADCHVAA